MKCQYPVSKLIIIDGNEWSYQHRCGRCIGCMLYRQAEWAGRILLEAKLPPPALFLTLTYDDEHYAKLDNGNLDKNEIPAFIKRLRSRIYPQKIRYYGAGEYGKETGRAHYHLVIFGYNIFDEPYKTGNKGETIWTGNIAQSWNKGFVSLLPLTPKLAMYVAKYIVKDSQQQKLLQGFHVHPFSNMSKRPPLGAGMLPAIMESRLDYINSLLASPFIGNRKKLQEPIFPDYVTIDGKSYPLGRTLSKKLSQLCGITQSNTAKFFSMELREIMKDPTKVMELQEKLKQIQKKLLR